MRKQVHSHLKYHKPQWLYGTRNPDSTLSANVSPICTQLCGSGNPAPHRRSLGAASEVGKELVGGDGLDNEVNGADRPQHSHQGIEYDDRPVEDFYEPAWFAHLSPGRTWVSV